jgi:hypothetical protein
MVASRRQIEANRRNWAKRGPLTEAGRQKLREACRRNRPWEQATGPRTPEGKAKVSRNALKHGKDTAQRRGFRRDAFRFCRLTLDLRAAMLNNEQCPEIDGLVAAIVRLSESLHQRCMGSCARQTESDGDDSKR